jgi:hypothetical protein
MITLREASGQDLVWVHPNPVTLAFELRSGSEVVATLHFAQRFSSDATGEAEGNRWTFAWEGIVRPRVRVRLAGAQSDVATVLLPLLGWSGRPWLVRFTDGRTFRWAPSGWTDFEYVLTGADGAALLRFKRPFFQPGWSRKGKKDRLLEIAPVARSLPELPLLVMLGRYLIQ